MKALFGTAIAVALAAATPALAQNGPAASMRQQPDQSFLDKASEANVSEVRLGRLALKKSDNPQVKRFAHRMIRDHRKAEKQLRRDTKGAGTEMPTQMSKDAEDLYNKLSQESGPQFDRDYMQAMVKDHQKDVNEFKDQAQNANSSVAKSYAQQTLPTLQEHLKMAQRIDQKVVPSEGR